MAKTFLFLERKAFLGCCSVEMNPAFVHASEKNCDKIQNLS